MANLGTQEKKTRGRVDPKQVTPVRILSATKAGSVLTVEFDQPVVLRGVPQYAVDVAGADPTSAEMTNLTTLELTYDAAIATATTMTIPVIEPGIRSKDGGYVADTTFPVS